MDGLMFNAENVLRTIQKLSVEIGPRYSGSPNCLKAGEYIETFFRNLNLEIEEQVFDIPIGELKEYRLEILEPALGEILCQPMYFTPNTSPDGLVGDLVYIESLETLQSEPGAAGKIVLLTALALQNSQDLRKLLMVKPLAVIVISADPGFKPRHDTANQTMFKQFKLVPFFRITWEDGYRLVQANAQKARMHLQLTIGMGKGRNIIAEYRGTQFPDEIIVICGHYDSPPDTPSATDNASGTAMVMELARIYAQKGSKRTIRFVAIDAEERFLVGSRKYAQTLYHTHTLEKAKEGFAERDGKTLLERHVLCINMDVLGMALGQHACYVIGPEELSATIRVLSKELGISQQIILDSLYGSDHEPFAWAGIPALDFSRIGPSMRYIHTDDDTVDLIKLERLQDVGLVVETFIDRYVANAKVWPFDRRIPAYQAEMIKNNFEKNFHLKLDEMTEKNNEH